MTGEHRHDLLLGRDGVGEEEPLQGEDETRGAIRALKGPVGRERLDDGIELAAASQPLRGDHGRTVAQRRERQAAAESPVVHQDGASAAHADAASVAHAAELEFITEDVEEARVTAHPQFAGGAVDLELDLDPAAVACGRYVETSAT